MRSTIIYRWCLRMRRPLGDLVVDAEAVKTTDAGVLSFWTNGEMHRAVAPGAWLDIERCQVVSDQ